MSAMTSSALSRTARSARQSGLKKPRPLRSVSLQEPTSNDGQRIVPERQLSHPSNSGLISPTTQNDFPVCEGISVMSAMLAAQAESEMKETSCSEHQTYQDKRQPLARQDSNSSYNSCQESESGCSSLSRQNSYPSEDGTTPYQSVSPCQDQRVSSSSQRGIYSRSLSNKSMDDNKKLSVDVNSNNLVSYSRNSTLCLSSNEDVLAHNPFATLVTSQGEEIILSGKNMQTILGAAKILVREMGASIVSLRVQDCMDGDDSPTEAKSDSSSSPNPDDQIPLENKKDSICHPPAPVIRYSKEELLTLSEGDLARKPPANWNILIHTHSDCCLPHDRMKEYFERIDFHRHDGTLVMEDRRIRERREKMPL